MCSVGSCLGNCFMELFTFTLASLSKTYGIDVDPWPAVKVRIGGGGVIALKFYLDSFVE